MFEPASTGHHPAAVPDTIAMGGPANALGGPATPLRRHPDWIKARMPSGENYHDLKEVERIGQVQLRRVWSNVGALNLSLWVHTLVEVWAWGRSESSLSDRSDRPWDDASRRPSHADRRRALQRELVAEEYRRLDVPQPWSEKIRHLLDSVGRLAA